ncbi:MAG: hypothetical protein UZ16_OP3001003551 [Candidatus Hinthialibacteria bacterium OLB16]|nr:MAG: hypothetical protein UZ16_OP3001003551 [Candidatus Hinthialibacteria bacterium OLB16]
MDLPLPPKPSGFDAILLDDCIAAFGANHNARFGPDKGESSENLSTLDTFKKEGTLPPLEFAIGREGCIEIGKDFFCDWNEVSPA